MYRLHLTGQPASVPSDVVFRIAPDAAMGAKELAVQRTVAEQGFPTPRVRLAGPANKALGGAWSVMDFASGTPPLSDLSGLSALRRAPGLLTSLPRMLATAMSALHGVDPGPITSAIDVAAPTVAWRVEDLLDHFETAAALLGRPELVTAVQTLASIRPSTGRTVICHGDLHPFNLLVDDAGHTTIVDWTGALRAEPAYDVAFTSLLLANPPLDAPRPLGTVIGQVGRFLSRRFITSYRASAPDNDLGPLDWYRGLHGARILIDAASHETRHGPNPAGHPFGALTPAAEAAIRSVTGTALSSPKRER
jgi:aminoglycoside phosphotransferase (APT) family kinase protein